MTECDCVGRMDRLMREAYANTVCVINLFEPKRAIVATAKASEKVRKKPAYLIATYCQFCGLKYPPRKGEQTEAAPAPQDQAETVR